MNDRDRSILRDLTEQYLAICERPEQQERRRLWRQHNSLKPTRPLIYVRAFAWRELAEAQCTCVEPVARQFETFFRQRIYWDSCRDDSIFEPWVTVNAACRTPEGGPWGLPLRWIASADPRGAKRMDPPIKDPADAQRMVKPHHKIDEQETQRRFELLSDAIGDLITINVDRGPAYQTWNADISTRLAQLRGLDQVMWDMMDRPDWLHDLVRFMRDGILEVHDEAEAAGDWGLCNHQNQAMSYAEELQDPAANQYGLQRRQLWTFCASQEFALVGPDLFDEFILQYQASIFEKFGLLAYGCCEDLTTIIPLLRQLPNLRRIAVSPMANVEKCAAQIRDDYVLSYRPSPADMVSYDFNPERIRRILRHDLGICRDSHVDITLKDVETVQNDPTRVPRWVTLTRQVIEEFWG